jgi:hypothetical protein
MSCLRCRPVSPSGARLLPASRSWRAIVSSTRSWMPMATPSVTRAVVLGSGAGDEGRASDLAGAGVAADEGPRCQAPASCAVDAADARLSTAACRGRHAPTARRAAARRRPRRPAADGRGDGACGSPVRVQCVSRAPHGRLGIQHSGEATGADEVQAGLYARMPDLDAAESCIRFAAPGVEGPDHQPLAQEPHASTFRFRLRSEAHRVARRARRAVVSGSVAGGAAHRTGHAVRTAGGGRHAGRARGRRRRQPSGGRGGGGDGPRRGAARADRAGAHHASQHALLAAGDGRAGGHHGAFRQPGRVRSPPCAHNPAGRWAAWRRRRTSSSGCPG